MIGYTAGCFDMIHVGHIRLLKESKAMCDKLIVGLTTDELCKGTKNKTPIIPYDHRREVLESLKCVDLVISQHNLDKFEAWRRLKFDILFVGDDHFNEPRWSKYNTQLTENGIKIVFLPYTQDISSTKLRNLI